MYASALLLVGGQMSPGYYQIQPAWMSQKRNGRESDSLPYLEILCWRRCVLDCAAASNQLQNQNDQRNHKQNVNQAADSTNESKCPENEQDYE
jgi:hypothetical protein